MIKLIFTLILTLIVSVTGYGQQPKPEAKAPQAQQKPESKVETNTEPAEAAIEGTAYHEITVQDFENIEFKPNDIIFQSSNEDEYYKVAIRDETPAPINSKKYLGVKLNGTHANSLLIKFPADKVPTIDKYVQSISMWVYGKNFSGELFLLIADGTGRTHKLLFGKLDFHGWRKLTKIIPADVVQNDKLLERKENVKILSILYVPGTWYRPGTNSVEQSLQTFYIDDISANVREKYKDVQNDEW